MALAYLRCLSVSGDSNLQKFFLQFFTVKETFITSGSQVYVGQPV